jgi:hypothetical protein
VNSAKDADVDRLTKQEIKNMRSYDPNHEGPLTPTGLRIWESICDLALQSLSQEAARNEVQEVFSRVANYQAASGNTTGVVTLTVQEFATLRAALKREPNTVLAPGERKPGEIAGPRNDAQVRDRASEEQVSTPVEDTNKREPNAEELMDSGYRSAMGLVPRPAPAAPDVASMVNEFNAMCDAFTADDEGLSLTPDVWNRLRVDLRKAAALLAKLGQVRELGWSVERALTEKTREW